MKQFNLEDFKAGKKVVTRGGYEVLRLTYMPESSTWKFAGVVADVLMKWKENGEYYCNGSNSDLDLMHPEEGMWINVYRGSFGELKTGYSLFSTNVEAKHNISNHNKYVGTYKLIKDEE